MSYYKNRGNFKCLLASIVFTLSACGGSSSTTPVALDEGNTDGLTAGIPGENTEETVIDTTGGMVGDTVLVPLSSLGPLQDRLYTSDINRRITTGPVIGSGLLSNSEMIYEVPFEVSEKVDEIEVEAVYLIRGYRTSVVGTELSLDRSKSIPQVVVLITNVSNKMVCNVRVRDLNVELVSGEADRVFANDFFGYAAVEEERFNSVSDRFDFDCLPPGRSAVAMGSIDEFSDDNPGDVEDVAKLVVGQLLGNVDEDYVSFTDGLYALSYVSDTEIDFRYSVTIANPSTRNLFHTISATGTVLLIDPSTGIPIGKAILGGGPDDFDIFAPGDEIEFEIDGGFRNPDFIGSTNSIMLFMEYFDDDSR